MDASALPNNETTKKVVLDFGYAFAPALALVFFLASALLAGMKNLVGLGRFASGNALVATAVSASFAWFGWFLVFREPRNTEVARAIIDFFGRPTFFASSTVAAIALVFFLLALIGKNDDPSVPKAG